MSGLFGLDDRGNQALRDEIAQNPILPDEVRPGFFAGIPGAIGRFPFQAAGAVARGVELAGAVPTGIVGSLLAPQVDVPQKYFETFDPAVKGWNDLFTADPRATGTAARVLGGFGQSATLLAAGGGNPALLIGATGLSGAMDLSDQGVSPDVAAAGGALESAATAAGFKVPFLGNTLPMRVATGAAGFATVNAATVEAQKQLLLATGYSNLAAAYQPLNGTDRSIDLLVGGLFGAIHHFGAGGMPITVDSRDAALALANARHVSIDAAPGFPQDVNTTAIHQEAIEQAMGQLLRDEPVVPPATLAEAAFAPKPAALPLEDVPKELKQLDVEQAKTQAAQALVEQPALKLDIPLGENVLDTQRPIESAFRQQIGTDPEAAMAAYAKLEDAKGGKVLNTDTARELSSAYLKDRTLSAAVHEPASALVKFMYTKRLTEEPKAGEEPLVLFTGGGTGAGKSTAIKDSLGNVADRAQIVYDANLDSAPKAIAKIQQALDAGKQVKIAYVFRDPTEALEFGALKRAMRQEKEHGSGRTIPIDTHVKTHTGSNEAIRQVFEHFQGHENVDFRFIDNSRGEHNAALISIDHLPRLDYNSVRESATQKLHELGQAGRISESIYRGFAGEQARTGTGEQVGLGPGARGQPESQHQAGRADQLGPEAAKPEPAVESAAQLATQVPDLRVATGGINADGSAETLTVAEAMARTHQQILDAEANAKAFGAAVNCAVQRGIQ